MNITDNFYWDKSFPLYKLEGNDSKKFLHSQTTIDAFSIEESSIVKTCWLSPVGRLKAILEIQIIEGIIYFIVIFGDPIEVVSGLEKVIFPSDKVKILSDGNIRRIQAISINSCWKSGNCVKWITKNKSIDDTFKKFKIAGKSIIQEWKIRQGLIEINKELNGIYNPYELGLADLVDLNKGCYLGQETLSKVFNSGKIKCQLMFFVANKVINIGDPLFTEIDNKNLNIGRVISMMRLQSQDIIGLAMIRNNILKSNSIKINNSLINLQLSEPKGFVKINSD